MQQFVAKRAGLFLFFFTLLCSVVIVGQSVGLVCAESHSDITIMSDGGVEGTDLILREGNVYTFAGDILGIIKVEKDGVVIDGAGYAIRGDGNGVILWKDSTAIQRVVVKNVRFCDGSRIFTSSNANNFTHNVFEGGGITIRGGTGGEGNIIAYNVFVDSREALFSDYSGFDVVFENDFVNCKIFRALYGCLMFDKNYWSDYEVLYPDAKEVGRTGVWNTPYTYDRSGHSFVDNNPLVNPTGGNGAPLAVEEPTSAQIVSIMLISTIVTVVIGGTLLLYFKKRN